MTSANANLYLVAHFLEFCKFSILIWVSWVLTESWSGTFSIGFRSRRHWFCPCFFLRSHWVSLTVCSRAGNEPSRAATGAFSSVIQRSSNVILKLRGQMFRNAVPVKSILSKHLQTHVLLKTHLIANISKHRFWQKSIVWHVGHKMTGASANLYLVAQSFLVASTCE